MSSNFLLRTEAINLELEEIKTSRSARSMLRSQQITKLEIIRRIQDDIHRLYDKHAQMEKAALTIQKLLRKFMDRRNKVDTLVETHRFKLQETLISLHDFSENLYFTFGDVLLRSTIKIQKSYRRIKVLRKIKRILKTYKMMMQINRYRAKEKLKLVLRCFINKIRKEDRFIQIENSNKLENIRINLAVLPIKLFFKQNSYYQVLSNIKRYKRKLNQSEWENDLVFKPGELNNRDLSENQKIIQEKIKSGYISYNIKHFKQKGINPVFSDNRSSRSSFKSWNPPRNYTTNTNRRKVSSRLIIKQ